MACIVIGNGSSRAGFDLSLLDQHETYGCNAIHRNYAPTHLIACDKHMVQEIKSVDKKVLTRYNFPDLPYIGKERPDQPKHWGSGSYAAYLACLDHQTLYFIGFDLYNENLYKGTDGYSNRAADPAYWIHQLRKLADCYPNKQFIFVQSKHWKPPSPWNTVNISKITYKKFIKHLTIPSK